MKDRSGLGGKGGRGGADEVRAINQEQPLYDVEPMMWVKARDSEPDKFGAGSGYG